jgi:hypothetical protein
VGLEVPVAREESGREQAKCVGESKGLIILSQEKQPDNNNYWVASECRTWNPASWNDHKSQGRSLSPALEEYRLGGPTVMVIGCRHSRGIWKDEESPR